MDERSCRIYESQAWPRGSISSGPSGPDLPRLGLFIQNKESNFMEPTFKVGHIVRVIHTDYPSEIPLGTLAPIVKVSVDGCGVNLYCVGHPRGLFFTPEEIEAVPPDYGVPTGGVPRRVTAVPDGFETSASFPGYMPTNPEPLGTKFDSLKPRWSLVPKGVIAQVVDVLTFGAAKYSSDNWMYVAPDKYYNALNRHIDAWRSGEKLDEETGKHHLAHALCCLMFMLWHDDNKPTVDEGI